MNATDELLTLLKEHGVEHYEHEAPSTDCIAFFDGEGWHDCWESVDGEVNVTFSMTPEQAIAATLRQAVRHPKPHEKWTTVLLPEIAWSWDDSWPDYLSVAHDTHGEWRTYVPEVTLGSNNCTNGERAETCEADETDLIPFVRADSDDFKVDYIHVMECTECGHTYEHVNGDYEYCPRCGRKRRDVEE